MSSRQHRAAAGLLLLVACLLPQFAIGKKDGRAAIAGCALGNRSAPRWPLSPCPVVAYTICPLQVLQERAR